MARVGIGVPVFNGGELLRKSLECLRTQSFEDIEVLIGDNASTDRTADICAEYAARDSRFRHLRRPENIGALANFVGPAGALASPTLFMWRAHDDLSDANYVEALVGVLDGDPGLDLAVGNVVSRPDDRAQPRLYPYRPPPAGQRIARVAHQLFASHASWIYGLWRRPALAREQARVRRRVPPPLGRRPSDMLPLILDGRVGGTRRDELHAAHRPRRHDAGRAPGAAPRHRLHAGAARRVRRGRLGRDRQARLLGWPSGRSWPPSCRAISTAAPIRAPS